ncbi:PKD domain-containing protein [Parapedobacter sp. 10938]|uniref:Ig-like domain-containing protein n=1 Tax=Parapedobacter flavus TaxID=3110225 RepID=UPI002DBC3E9C|nr:PKD domain-containing protein [Parapedobacter sp. 10938]MEC3881814.1 PKD domain-containing protein [Parapedobacter sp. 10938]
MRTESVQGDGGAPLVQEVYTFTIRSVLASFIDLPETDLISFCEGDGTLDLYDYFSDKSGVTFKLSNESGTIQTGNIIEKSNFEAGTYTITASKQYDNGLYSKSIDLKVTALPVAKITTSIPGTTFCAGTQVTLSAPEAPEGMNYTYEWSTGHTSREITVTNTVNAISVTVSNGDCSTISETVSLTATPWPDAEITIQTGGDRICEGETAVLSGPEGEGITHEWLDEDNSVIGSNQLFSTSETGTYRVRVTNENGCSNTSEPVTIIVQPNPTPEIIVSGTLEFCEGGSVILTASMPNGSAPANLSWSNGENGQSITVTETGIYSVRANNSNGCVSESETVEVVVIPNLKPTIFATGPIEFCEGGSVTLTASTGASYLWSNGETTREITTDNTGQYTVTVTNIAGCESTSDPVTVTVLQSQVPEIAPLSSTEICEGETVTLQVTNAQAGYAYQWSNGETGIQNEVSVAGEYYVIAVNDNDCSNSSETLSVTVNPIQKPQVTLSGNTTFCEGDSVVMTVTNLSPGTTVRWSDGTEGPTNAVKASGNYIAYISNGECERASDPVNVAVLANSKPSIQALGPTEFCEGDSVTLSISNPLPGISYTWSNGQQAHQIKVKQNGQYYVVAQNDNGCSQISNLIDIEVSPLEKPLITTSGPLEFCQGESVTLTINQTGSSYRWSNGETTKSITVATSQTVTAYITNDDGCERASDPIAVTMLPNTAPNIQALGLTEFCEGDSVILSVTNPMPGVNYRWSNGLQTHSIKVKDQGQYYVIAENENGCSAVSQIIEITVNPIAKPTISANNDIDICNSDSLVLTIDQTADSYRWNTGETTRSITVKTGGTFIGYIQNEEGCERASDPISISVKDNKPVSISIFGNTTFCEGDSVVLTANQEGDYLWSNGATTRSITLHSSATINLKVINSEGCEATSEDITITVHPLPKPTISANGPLEFCSDDSVTLSIDQVGASYRWSNGATTRSITVAVNQTLTAYITNEEGCERASDPVTVVVNPNPIPTVNITGQTEFCEGDSVTLSVTPISGYTYLWSNGQQGHSISVFATGTYFVTAITPDNCSSNSNPVDVVVFPLPKPTISVTGQLEICQGDSVTLTIDQVATSYRWSNGATTQSIKVGKSQTVTAYISNEEGCERASDPISVVVTPNPIPVINTSGPTVFCEGDSVRLSVTPIAGYIYVWSDGQEGSSITVTTGGTYYVSSQTPDGCSRSSEDVEVTVYPLPKPTVSILGQLEFCAGDSVTLIIDQEATGYRWSNGATTKSITVKSSANLVAYVSNEEGCERSSEPITVRVTPNPVPTITITGSTVFCDGDSVILTASPSVSYLWSNGATTQSITVRNPGDYYVVTTNTEGCQSQSQTISVTVTPNDVPTITSSLGQDFCIGDTTILTASEGQLYRWSTGETTRSIRVTESGEYTVTVVNENNCERTSESFQVSAHEPIPLQTIPDFMMCVNAPELNLDSINTNSFDNGRYSGTAVTHKFFNPEIAGVGFHEITYSTISEYGCESFTSFMIEVVPLKSIEPGPDTTVCINGPEVPLDAPGVPVETEISGQGVTGRRFIPSEAGIGTHLITYVYVNAANCVTTATRTITVMPAPETPTVTGNQPVCANTTLTLTASSNVAGGMDIIYRWYRPDEMDPFAEGKTISFTVTVNETIYVEAVSDKTCSSLRQAVNITSMTPYFTLNASATEVLQGTPVTFTLNELPDSAPAVRWEWDFSDGFSSSENQPKHYFNKPGEYTVKVRAFSVEGCMADKEITVTVNTDTVSYDPPENETEPAEDDRPFTQTVVYPNPVTDQARMRTYNETQKSIPALLEIYTISGKLVSYEKVTIQPGANEFELPGINRLVAQTYYLVVLREDGGRSTMETFKILKL